MFKPIEMRPAFRPQDHLVDDRAEASLQQNRVKRLGQVILRAQFDTLDHGFEFRRSRNHDDGRPLQPPLFPHPGQDVDPVHPRHHYVEQNHVKASARQCFQGFDTVRGLNHIAVAEASQTPCQEVAVLGIVIDDEQFGFSTAFQGRSFWRRHHRPRRRVGTRPTATMRRLGRLLGFCDGLRSFCQSLLETARNAPNEPISLS